QAEDGIRDFHVTGVQTCALPIWLRLPLQSYPLQALVSELLEPVLGCVVMSNAVHVYVSQAHKGELVMGAGIDPYNSYGQRGAFRSEERRVGEECRYSRRT